MEQLNIPRFDTESDLIYNYRVSYIHSNLNDMTVINQLIKNSKILANIKFNKCKYDSKIYNSLKDFL